MIARILFGVALLVTLFVTPWWVTLLLVLAGLIYFPFYIEVLFVGLFFDALYGAPMFVPWLPYAATMLAVVFLICAQQVRERLIMY